MYKNDYVLFSFPKKYKNMQYTKGKLRLVFYFIILALTSLKFYCF